MQGLPRMVHELHRKDAYLSGKYYVIVQPDSVEAEGRACKVQARQR